MSHLPERKERICLNCKSVIYGRFCHVCGQENIEPKESVWHLITHFVYDLTHFDGKFFLTMKFLLLKPGYLSREYLRGRRAAYLNPIRMYIFTSALFFIIFFSFIIAQDEKAVEEVRAELMLERKELEKKIAIAKDSVEKKRLERKLKRVNTQMQYAGQTGIIKVADDEIDSTNKFNVIGDDFLPKTVKAYDSLQASLPAEKRDNWIERIFYRKVISINDKYRYNERAFWKNINEKFTHYVPQMMFVSLPLVALILQLLYFRRKQFFYVNHLIFTINLYIASYILLLFFYSFAAIHNATGFGFFKFLSIITYLGIFFYAYKAMRNFYHQRRAKTIFKFLIFCFAFLLLMVFLMALYFFTSALQI